MNFKKLNEQLEKFTEGEKTEGYWNSKIKVGDKVETEDGRKGEVIKRYHDFGGQLRYRIQPEKGEYFSEFWGRVRLADSNKKRKEIDKKIKSKKYTVEEVRQVVVKTCQKYGTTKWGRNITADYTLDGDILITKIPDMLSVGALYSVSEVVTRRQYFDEIINNLVKFFEKYNEKINFVGGGKDIVHGELQIHFN